MKASEKAEIVLIGLITAIFSLLAGGFLGDINYISLVIASMPLVLGRILIGKAVLNYIGLLYTTSIIFLSLVQAPIKLFPELYGRFYLELYSTIFGIPNRAVIGNLDSALAYEPIIACLAVFSILYIHREDYTDLIKEKLS